MERELLQFLARELTREATLFIFALLLFLPAAICWRVTAPFVGLVLVVVAIRGCVNFRRSLQQYYAGISKWPPLSREDCRVAQSKLKRKPQKILRRTY